MTSQNGPAFTPEAQLDDTTPDTEMARAFREAFREAIEITRHETDTEQHDPAADKPANPAAQLPPVLVLNQLYPNPMAGALAPRGPMPDLRGLLSRLPLRQSRRRAERRPLVVIQADAIARKDRKKLDRRLTALPEERLDYHGIEEPLAFRFTLRPHVHDHAKPLDGPRASHIELANDACYIDLAVLGEDALPIPPAWLIAHATSLVDMIIRERERSEDRALAPHRFAFSFVAAGYLTRRQQLEALSVPAEPRRRGNGDATRPGTASGGARRGYRVANGEPHGPPEPDQ